MKPLRRELVALAIFAAWMAIAAALAPKSPFRAQSIQPVAEADCEGSACSPAPLTKIAATKRLTKG